MPRGTKRSSSRKLKSTNISNADDDIISHIPAYGTDQDTTPRDSSLDYISLPLKESYSYSSLKLPPDTPTIELQPEVKKRKRSDIESKDIHKQIERKRTRRLNDAMYKLQKLLKEQGIDVKKDKISILSNTLEFLRELHKKQREQEEEGVGNDIVNDDVDMGVDTIEMEREENEENEDENDDEDENDMEDNNNDENDGNDDDDNDELDMNNENDEDNELNNSMENDDCDEKSKHNYLFPTPPQQSPLGSPLSSSFVLFYIYYCNRDYYNL